jgi:asparagine synthetase B (glutamine-hydrolysing)
MCGIFGVIDFKDKIDKDRIISARDVIAHTRFYYNVIYFLILVS